jgi:hypothetical protein
MAWPTSVQAYSSCWRFCYTPRENDWRGVNSENGPTPLADLFEVLIPIFLIHPGAAVVWVSSADARSSIGHPA